MTESEAKGFIQGKLDCMEKCDVFNKEDKHSNNECELCKYCYSQGNLGQQKEAFQMAINALENVSDDVCEWRLCDEESNVYDTSCRNPHILIEGTPKENNYEYCPYCGKKIKVAG